MRKAGVDRGNTQYVWERERKREKGKREPRRYKLKLQEFLWPCISVSVGLGFLTNIHSERTPERGGRGQLVLTTHICEAIVFPYRIANTEIWKGLKGTIKFPDFPLHTEHLCCFKSQTKKKNGYKDPGRPSNWLVQLHIILIIAMRGARNPGTAFCVLWVLFSNPLPWVYKDAARSQSVWSWWQQFDLKHRVTFCRIIMSFGA